MRHEHHVEAFDLVLLLTQYQRIKLNVYRYHRYYIEHLAIVALYHDCRIQLWRHYCDCISSLEASISASNQHQSTAVNVNLQDLNSFVATGHWTKTATQGKVNIIKYS